MLVSDYSGIKGELNLLLKDNEIFKDILSNINEVLDEKIRNFNPTFMIYGTYNSGKSTLLNALFGKEKAAMGDIPTTKEVHTYEYEGVTIFDTPGLNANDTDDKTSLEHLLKSDVAIFVLSNNGSVEERYIYEKIAEILKNNKKLLIIINNKAGLDELQNARIVDKVAQNLEAIAKEYDLKNAQNINIKVINAASALKARLENKSLLLENSGFNEVEFALKKLIQDSDKSDVENTINIFLKTKIDEIITICDSNLQNERQKSVSELITFLEKKRQTLQDKLNSRLKSHTINLKDELVVALSSENVNESIVDKIIQEKLDIFEKEILENISRVSEDVSLKVEKLNSDFMGLNGVGVSVNMQDLKSGNLSDENSTLIPDELKDGALKMITDKDLVASATKTTLEFIKETLPKLMRGKGKVWIDKISQAAGKYFGPAISVFMAGYDIYKANKEHEKMVEQQRQRVASINNIANQISDTIFVQTENEVEKIISEIFTPLLKTYTDTLRSLSGKNENLENIKSEILKISSKIV